MNNEINNAPRRRRRAAAQEKAFEEFLNSQQNAEKPASTDGAGVDMTQPGTTGSTAPAETSGNEAAGSTTAPTETEETRPGGLEEDELPPIPV